MQKHLKLYYNNLMIAFRLTALQFSRVVLEPSVYIGSLRHPTSIETSINVYDSTLTSYVEGSTLTKPLQQLKSSIAQDDINAITSLIFDKHPGEVLDESYPGGRAQALAEFRAWMTNRTIPGGSMVEHSWTTLRFGRVVVLSTLRATEIVASNGEGIYMEWDGESSIRVNMPLDVLRRELAPDEVPLVVQGLLKKERKILDRTYNGGYAEACHNFTMWMTS